MHSQVIAPSVAVLKPVRLNFAGVCIYCGVRDCVSARCVAAHELSRWVVCGNCNGSSFQFGSPDDPCFCCFGLVERALPYPFDLAAIEVPAVVASPAAVAPVSDAPVSVPPVLVSAPLPRCLTCGHRTAVKHSDCLPPRLNSWTPCSECEGRRMDADGFECAVCDGVGFIEQNFDYTLSELEVAGPEVAR